MTDLEIKTAEEQAKLDEILRQQSLVLESINSLKLQKEGIETEVKESQDRLSLMEGKESALKQSLSDVQEALEETNASEVIARRELNHVVSSHTIAKKNAENEQRMADAHLESTKTEQKRVMEEIAKHIEAGKKEIDALNVEKNAISNDLDVKKTEINVLTGRKQSLEKYIESLDTEKGDLETKITRRESSLKTAQKTLENLETDISSRKNEIAVLDAEIEQIRAYKRDADKELSRLEQEVKKNATTNDDFLRTRSEVMAKSVELEQRLEFLKTKYGAVGEIW